MISSARIQHLPINPFTRPGWKRISTKAIDLHWNGNAGMNEFQLAQYFEDLSKQNPEDQVIDRFAGANYIVGAEAVIEIVPPEEITYTAGADGERSFYTPHAKRIFGKKYTSYWPDSFQPFRGVQRALSPNFLTVSIEIVHPTESGEFDPIAVDRAVALTRDLAKKYPKAVTMRHFDITEKLCPKYWVLYPAEWRSFQKRVFPELISEDV